MGAVAELRRFMRLDTIRLRMLPVRWLLWWGAGAAGLAHGAFARRVTAVVGGAWVPVAELRRFMRLDTIRPRMPPVR
ncbi:hypothetical protein [Amycolatopsis sp. NPDC051102]|uniref:hypothetical protein n=1 Tax=Amycolatopsis sp. NPDC051102 TaxID=3155163 RepID=UPI00343F9C2E